MRQILTGIASSDVGPRRIRTLRSSNASESGSSTCIRPCVPSLQAMVPRLQKAMGKMYKPPVDGARQVFALSRNDAEKVPRLPPIAIISVTAPERPPASLDGFAHLLRLSFADVDVPSLCLSKKARGKLVHAFTTVQAQAIRAFVEALPDEIASVVVHCEGGYSRSPVR